MSSNNINKIPWLFTRNTNQIVSKCIDKICNRTPPYNDATSSVQSVIISPRPENRAPVRTLKVAERLRPRAGITSKLHLNDSPTILNGDRLLSSIMQSSNKRGSTVSISSNKKILNKPSKYKIYNSRRFGSSASSSNGSILRGEKRRNRYNPVWQTNYLLRSFGTMHPTKIATSLKPVVSHFLPKIRNQHLESNLGSVDRAIQVSTAIQADLMAVDRELKERIAVAKIPIDEPPAPVMNNAKKALDSWNYLSDQPTIVPRINERWLADYELFEQERKLRSVSLRKKPKSPYSDTALQSIDMNMAPIGHILASKNSIPSYRIMQRERRVKPTAKLPSKRSDSSKSVTPRTVKSLQPMKTYSKRTYGSKHSLKEIQAEQDSKGGPLRPIDLFKKQLREQSRQVELILQQRREQQKQIRRLLDKGTAPIESKLAKDKPKESGDYSQHKHHESDEAQSDFMAMPRMQLIEETHRQTLRQRQRQALELLQEQMHMVSMENRAQFEQQEQEKAKVKPNLAKSTKVKQSTNESKAQFARGAPIKGPKVESKAPVFKPSYHQIVKPRPVKQIPSQHPQAANKLNQHNQQTGYGHTPKQSQSSKQAYQHQVSQATKNNTQQKSYTQSPQQPKQSHHTHHNQQSQWTQRVQQPQYPQQSQHIPQAQPNQRAQQQRSQSQTYSYHPSTHSPSQSPSPSQSKSQTQGQSQSQRQSQSQSQQQRERQFKTKKPTLRLCEDTHNNEQKQTKPEIKIAPIAATAQVDMQMRKLREMKKSNQEIRRSMPDIWGMRGLSKEKSVESFALSNSSTEHSMTSISNTYRHAYSDTASTAGNPPPSASASLGSTLFAPKQPYASRHNRRMYLNALRKF